jgi:hypothetical protein
VRSILAVLGMGWPVLGLSLWATMCCLYFHFLEVTSTRAAG